MSETANPQIIGFDLGHGESAVTATHPDEYVLMGKTERIKEPVPLRLVANKTSTVTALAYDDRIGVIFGEDAVRRHTAREFYVAFKRRPDARNGANKLIRDFAQAVFRHLGETHNMDANARTFVGCPSGWPKESVDLYQRLMAEAGLRNVMVVRESRAALMHAQESQYFTVAQLKKSVLVVDVGSSTTDFTLVRNLEDSPVDFGQDLGAALIDRAILNKTIEADENASRWKQIFAELPAIRYQCEFVCRQAKEAYFSHSALYEDEPVGIDYRPHGGGDLRFEPKVNGPFMHEILATPMPELHGRSWPDAFRDALLDARGQLDRAGVRLSGLLLTGGASRMKFVRDLCREVFPGVDFKPDDEPELCIARGLARWGRVYVRTETFVQKIEAFIEQELDAIVANRIPDLLDAIADALAGDAVEKVLKPRMRAWRDGSIRTLNGLQSDIGAKAKEWIESEAAKDRITRCMIEFLNTIMSEVEKRTAAIRAEYGLPLGSLGGKVVHLHPKADGFYVSLDVGDPTELTGVIAPIVTTVVGIVLAAVAHVFLFAGPGGWIAGIIVFLMAAGATESFLKDADLWQFVRNAVGDEKIDAVGREQRPVFRGEILKMFLSDEELVGRITRPLKQWVKDAVREQADRARLLIA